MLLLIFLANSFNYAFKRSPFDLVIEIYFCNFKPNSSAMSKLIFVIYLTFIFAACQNAPKQKANATKKIPQQTIVCQLEDSLKIQSILKQFEDSQEKTTAELAAQVGRQFLEVPYVAHTLEHGVKEPLTVESDALDCTTFVETALALARTIKSDNPDFDQFAHELEKIRYRDGKRQGYTSRLHYFSDWIDNNQQKGLISQPAESFGAPLDIEVNFMSTHPDSYAVLKENPALVDSIAQQEKQLSARSHFYLPKDKIEANEKNLKEGDIIGLVTTVKGLDIAHTGILVEVDGRIHLMHASSLGEKVMISKEPLSDLVLNKKSYSGIMIARPLN